MDRTEVAQFYAGIFAAFPGCSLTLHETFSDGDRLVCRFTLAGRHDGPFRGVPARRRPAGDHHPALPQRPLRRALSSADMLGVLVQIGAVPMPA